MYSLRPEYIEVICYSRLLLLAPQTFQWHAKVCGFIGLSSSICKLPIRSEIYNCTFKNTNKVSIIIVVVVLYPRHLPTPTTHDPRRTTHDCSVGNCNNIRRQL